MQSTGSLKSVIKTAVTSGGFMIPEKVIINFGLAEGMNIADFGCGSGHFAILSAKRVGESGKVYAIDIMESSLDTVKSKSRSENLSNMEFIRADLEVLGGTGLGDGSQDVVLIHNILFQSKKKEEIISEANRVLKIGGRLILIEWAKSSGGFGPPNELRLDEIAAEAMIAGLGFGLEKKIDGGQFHYGLMFRKS